jgi:hypothetical protein
VAGDRELLQFRAQAPVAADHPFDQAFVRQVVQAFVFAVALPGGIDEREIARLAAAHRIALVGPAAAFEEARLQRQRDLFGKADAHKAAGGYRVAVTDQPHGFGGADDLAVMRVRQCGELAVLGLHGGSPAGLDGLGACE